MTKWIPICIFMNSSCYFAYQKEVNLSWRGGEFFQSNYFGEKKKKVTEARAHNLAQMNQEEKQTVIICFYDCNYCNCNQLQNKHQTPHLTINNLILILHSDWPGDVHQFSIVIKSAWGNSNITTPMSDVTSTAQHLIQHLIWSPIWARPQKG